MKILTLYFKNINSLEGESLIDFQKKPLANAGVFAITGPNGSGKTSLLDAISLAFYGETFRFDRPAEHVITHNATESFAQVEFSIADKKFKTRWHLQRKNNKVKAELLEPTMQLFALNINEKEELLAESLQTVVSKINQILGMDFHSFSRSIMLAQGDFAAFLNALDNERMGILEKMSSIDIYEEYKQELRTKTQQSERALAQLKNDLNTLPIMSTVEVETCHDNLIDFKEQLDDYRQQKNEFKEQLAWYQRIRLFKQQILNLNKKQGQNNQQLDYVEKKRQTILSLEKALDFKDDVSAMELQQQQFKQSKKSVDSATYELEQLKKQQQKLKIKTNVAAVEGKNSADQKQVIDKLRYQVQQKNVVLKTETSLIELINKDIIANKTRQTEILVWLDAHSTDKTLLDGFPETKELKQLSLDLSKREQQYQATEKQTKEVQLLLEKNQDNETIEVQKTIETKQLLMNAEKLLDSMIEDSPLIERQHLAEDQLQRTNDFKELYTLAKINNRVSNRGFLGLFSQKKSEERLSVKELNQQAKEITKKISESQFLRNTLEKAIINEKLLKKMLTFREHLEKDFPCPLCGAIEHPFTKTPPRETDSQQTLKDQKNKLHLLIVQADKIKMEIINRQKHDEKETVNANNLQKNRSQWRILTNKLNVSSKLLEINNFSLMKQLLKQSEGELNEFKQHLSLFQQQQLLIEKLTIQLEAIKESVVTLKTELERLQIKDTQLQKILPVLKIQLEKMTVDEKILSDKTIKKLASLNEKIPIKDTDDLLLERLKIREQDYKIYLEKGNMVKNNLLESDNKIINSQQKMKKLTAEISQHEQVLKVEESIGLYLAEIEKQKLIINKEQVFQQQQQQLQQLEKTLTEKLQASSFSDLNELKEALILVTKQAEVEQKYASLQQESTSLEQEQQQLESQLKAEQNLEINLAKREVVELKSRALDEKISITNDEIRYLNDLQHKQVKIQQQHALLSEKLQQQQQHFDEAKINLCESENNGIVFRRRVQLKMATKLLSQTNNILEKMNGRYYIRQAPSDTGLALEIEDTKQQNSRRLPKSLSGGESFVVSLALALGLSELANNGKAVNSLFLDEGFGNLDSETLYTVVTTLQSLKTQGKTVGIISHVDGVKKRIKTRIEMVKKMNGLSKLKKIS